MKTIEIGKDVSKEVKKPEFAQGGVRFELVFLNELWRVCRNYNSYASFETVEIILN